MAANSFLQAIFKGPKFSVAPIEVNNKGNCRIGQVVPVYSRVLNPREGLELDLGHLVRFMPAQAPTMEGYKVTFDAFAVPFSTLGYAERKERDIDDFFNIRENGGEITNPFCFSFDTLNTPATVAEGVGFQVKANTSNRGFTDFFVNGSLGDYINWPSLRNIKKHVRWWLDVNGLLDGHNISRLVTIFDSDLDHLSEAANFFAFWYADSSLAYSNDFDELSVVSGQNQRLMVLSGIPFNIDEENPLVTVSAEDDTRLFYNAYTDTDVAFRQGVNVFSLLGYVCYTYPRVAEYYGLSDSVVSSSAEFHAYLTWLEFQSRTRPDFTYNFLDILYRFYKIDAQSVYDEYFNYVLRHLLYKSDILNYDGNTLVYEEFLPWFADDDPVDLSYFAAYWKIISDWYINTNIDGDPDEFFLKHCQLLTYDHYGTMQKFYQLDLEPFQRRWSNDIFTSAVPQAQIQNVRIPADGTIPDLREANAYQKLVDIFRNTGRRLRDVIYGVFGIRASAVRSEMSEPIGSLSSWIGMQSVLQTSETTIDSPQAAYAGIGTDSSSHKRILKYVNNAEPTPVIIMVLMSVTQKATYTQGFDRKFKRSSIYDFAIPELAMVGEQAIRKSEIYFDMFTGLATGYFGFNRRYYDWFYQGNEIHGDLRDSMDYWHGARLFDTPPSLNSQFIGTDSERDHLQRVFANVSESSRPIWNP